MIPTRPAHLMTFAVNFLKEYVENKIRISGLLMWSKN